MASLRKAANEMCKTCVYDKTVPGTWREQVEACKCDSCPLFEHRPMSGTAIAARRAAKKQVPIALAA